MKDTNNIRNIFHSTPRERACAKLALTSAQTGWNNKYMFIKHDKYTIFNDDLKHDDELLCGGEKKNETKKINMNVVYLHIFFLTMSSNTAISHDSIASCAVA